MRTFILKRDGEEVARGDEFALLKFIQRKHSYSMDHALRYEGYSVSLTFDTWLTDNAAKIRDITSAQQKLNGDCRMFVVESGGVGKPGRIVYFGRTRAGTVTPRQMPIDCLKPDGKSVRWPGNISKATPFPATDDAARIRYAELQIKKWGKA
jgi:hypothetical protein